MIEIKGLGLGQDLNLNINANRHAIFSQRKESTSASATNDDEDVSMLVRVRQFMMQKVIIPFAKELREGDPVFLEGCNNDAICDCIQSALCLESDMPFLTLLKREEVEEQMIRERINAGKIRAGFAECGSSYYKSRLFANVKFNQKRETAEQVETPL